MLPIHYQVEKLVAPNPESVEAVNAWLKENNITTSTNSPAGDWLAFSLPVSKANELFSADFSVFTHTESGAEVVRTLSYILPASLQQHVDLVHPMTR